MRLYLPVAILGLAASAVAADGPNSWEAWVKEWPKCAQSCLDTYYDGTLAEKCGKDAKSSTDSKDVKCVCTARADLSMADDAKDLYTCTRDKCAGADQDDVDKATAAGKKLADLCSDASDSSSSSSDDDDDDDDRTTGMSHNPVLIQGEQRLTT